MSTAARIIVSQRVDDLPARNERRDALDQRLCQWVIAAGFQPIPIPNSLVQLDRPEHLADLETWVEDLSADAILLSGGNDIGEAPERDLTETILLDLSYRHSIPALGICRGMQMMASWAGGHLIQVSNHVGIHHRLETAPDTGEWPVEVNSYHNQGLETCPPGFVVTARAEDGTIEAICHERVPWEGWMWHPEREPTPVDCEMQRLRQLVESRSKF